MAGGTAWRIAPHRLYDRFHPEERLKLIGDRMKCMRCTPAPASFGMCCAHRGTFVA
jgi:hypothetical protein